MLPNFSESLSTHSKFVYGLEINARKNFLDFKEGLVSFALRIPKGKYSPRSLAKKLEQEINRVTSNVYSVTYDYSLNVFQILKTPASPFVSFEILAATGPNAAYSFADVIGISGDVIRSNVIGVGSVIYSNVPPLTKIYTTQFPLQDFNDADSHVKLFDSVVNTTYGNRKELVSFGEINLVDMRFDWITDRAGHDGSFGFLRDKHLGKQQLRELMMWLLYKGQVDFFKDEASISPDYTLVNDGGTEFFLREKTAQNLPSYFFTDKMTFSVVKYLDEDNI